MTNDERETIAAIATPPGRGGIGILRLSGPDAVGIAAPLLRLRGALEPNRARFCEIVEPAVGEPVDDEQAVAAKLDEAVVTWFAAPHSYTGEHVLEIAAHGSPVLLDFLLRQVTARGARLANPGEFTERAFLAGRLDLTQAEAVRDLIEAQTLYQARVAASQLDGALSRRVAPIKGALIHLIAQLEAGIDFAEDDTPTLSAAAISALALPISNDLSTLARSFEHGRLVHAGLTLAIVGEPNVGKSSLFNCLVERERAIVTSAPGTTRDLVTERISIAGLPVELVDTAGIREAVDEAEKLGVERSRQALAEADLVLIVLDARQVAGSIPGDTQAMLGGDSAAEIFGSGHLADERVLRIMQEGEAGKLLALTEGRASLVVLNKCDLLGSSDLNMAASNGVFCAEANCAPGKLRGDVEELVPESREGSRGETRAACIFTSAHTGQGIQELRKALAAWLHAPSAADQAGIVTNLRQHQAVASARASLSTAESAVEIRLPHEMVLMDLYAALHSLDSLTGVTTADDILRVIFSTFCVGK